MRRRAVHEECPHAHAPVREGVVMRGKLLGKASRTHATAFFVLVEHCHADPSASAMMGPFPGLPRAEPWRQLLSGAISRAVWRGRRDAA